MHHTTQTQDVLMDKYQLYHLKILRMQDMVLRGKGKMEDRVDNKEKSSLGKYAWPKRQHSYDRGKCTNGARAQEHRARKSTHCYH